MNPRQRRQLSFVAAAAVLVALAGCPANNTPQAMPPSPPPGSGYEPPDNAAPEPTDAATAAPDAADVTQSPGCPGGAGCPAQADGAPCLAATDCTSGVCEGLGCGADTPGVCMPKSRRCTRDRRPYCGCDGNTFYGSGTCPGKRYSARDMCPDGR